MQPTPRQDPGRWADRRCVVTVEGSRPHAVPLGTPVRGLAGPHAKGSFDRGQSPARCDHARWRRGHAQGTGGGGNCRDPAGATPPQGFALAERASPAQVGEAGCCGAGQQDGAHCLEDDAFGWSVHRDLRGCRLAGRLRTRQARGATEPQPCCAGARACKVTSRWCDRSIHDARHSDGSSGHLQGRSVVWNSRRGNHLGQRSCANAPTGRTYGRKQAGQSYCNAPCEEGAVHIWIQAYAPEIEKRIRPHLRPSNGSWRVDETYVKVKGRWMYLYRAVDSRGQTIDFLFSAKRDAAAAKRFFRKALGQPHTVAPRTVSVDKNAAWPPAIMEMKKQGELWRFSRLRQVKYLNNIVEQDHRGVKRLVRPGLGFGSLPTARRTLVGYEGMAMIRKGQVRNIGGGEMRAQAAFVAGLFGIAA